MAATTWNPVDRTLGLGISLCGLGITVFNVSMFVAQMPEFAVWWQVLCLIFPVGFAVLAIGWRRIRPRVLRTVWTALPFLYIVVLLLTCAVWNGVSGTLPVPAVWTLDTAVLGLMLLAVRPLPVIGLLFGMAVTPSLSALVFLGEVPRSLVSLGLMHLSSIMLMMLVLLLRAQMKELHQTRRVAALLRAEEARAKADAEESAEYGRMIHDEVLSTFAAALRLPGDPPPELRQGAAAALRALHLGARSGVGPDDAEYLRSEDVARLVVALVSSAAPEVPVESAHQEGAIPAAVAGVLGLAAAEAARNAVRHAGGGRGEVVAADGTLCVRISDDGPGFESSTIPPGHFGVRESILRRMRTLDGGAATIESGSDGTTVEVRWTQPTS